MGSSIERLVVVGAGAAGCRALGALIAQGYPGELHVVAGEPQGPYYRPALSKQLLSGSQTLDQVRRTLALDERVIRYDGRAAGLDLDAREITLADGRRIAFDRLLLAPGSQPRTLPGLAASSRITGIDDPDQVSQVRARLSAAKTGGAVRYVVVGGGLIGAETASTLRAAGAEVTIVDPSVTPLHRALGAHGDQLASGWHAEHGVITLLGRSVVSVAQDADGVDVVLDDGTTLRADHVVVAVGARPATDWLEGSGIPLAPDGGIEVDERLLVPGIEGVAAAGDAAAWFSARLGRRVRVEHWAAAVEEGAVAAYNLTHPDPHPFDTVPMFWTEQHGRLVHLVGERAAESTWIDVTESPLPRGGQVFAAVNDGVVTGYLLIQAPQLLRRYQQALAEAASKSSAPLVR